jgi:hypothetical protein
MPTDPASGDPAQVSARAPRVRTLSPLATAAVVVALARWPAARALVPGLGVFTGALGGLLAAVGTGASLGLALRSRPRVGRLPAWALFGVAAALSAAFAVHYARAVEPSGDEIDYLLMAQSVWREGDLDLRDNFARGDHLEYLGGYDRMPGGTRRADGRPYPTHSAGLSVLLAPAYAVGGRRACVVLLALVAAGLGVVVRDLARRAGADEEAALLCAAAAVGPPVLYYSAFLYTEVPVAFAIALALRLLLHAPGPWAAAGAALALSTLPWLHVRMTLAAAALGAFAVFRLRGRPRLAFLAVAAATAVSYAGYQYSVFRTLSPYARYAGQAPIPMARATPLRTVFGLFLDGAYGLLPYAPVFLLAFAGLGVLFARGRRDRWALLAVALGVLLPVLAWRNWWGFSPPARFTIPLVPVLALAVAGRLAAAPGRGLARWRWGLAAAGTGLALLMFADPRAMRMVNGRHGPPQVLELVAGEVSLSRYLPYPSSRAGSTAPPWEPPASEVLVMALWVAALAALLVLDRLSWKRDRVDRWFRGLALPVLLFLALSVAVDRWARPEGAPRLGSSTRPSSSESMIRPASPRAVRRERARRAAGPFVRTALGPAGGPCVTNGP